MRIPPPALAGLLLGYCSLQVLAQPAQLSLGSGSGPPGSTVTLNMSLGGGASPAGMQWDLNYPSADVTFEGATTGSAASDAEKSVQCNGTGGTTTCLVFGFNANTMSDGVVARVSFGIVATTLAPSAAIGFSNMSATDPGGQGISITGTGNQITIQQAVNNAPTADDNAVATPEDTPLPVTLTGSDPDGDPLTFTVTSSPSNGNLSGTAPNLTYSPASNFHGGDSLTFQANDGKGGVDSGTVSITVTPVNDPPVAQDQNVTTSEDTARAITLVATDADGDPLTFTVATGPSNGSLSGTAPNITYTPNGGYAGPDSVTFQVSDNNGGIDTGTVNISGGDSEKPGEKPG